MRAGVGEKSVQLIACLLENWADERAIANDCATRARCSASASGGEAPCAFLDEIDEAGGSNLMAVCNAVLDAGRGSRL